MNLFKKLNYLIDGKTKSKMIILLGLILVGSLVELLGVSILLPIIDLAVDSSNYMENQFCKIIVAVTGVETKKEILIYLIIATILIYILKNLYLSFMNSYMFKVAAQYKRQLATKLMKAYLKQPYSFFLYKNSSELIRSVNEDSGQFYQVILNMLRVLSNGITVFCIAVYLAITNWAMTLTVVIFLGVCVGLVIKRVQKKTAVLGKKKQAQSANLIQYLQQSIEGIKEIKILNSENYFMSKYDETYYSQAEVERKYNLLNWLPKYLIEAVVIAAVMGYLGVNVLINPNYSSLVPQLAIFVAGAYKMLPAVNGGYSYLNTAIFYRASVDLIYHDIKETEHLKDEIIASNEDIVPMPFTEKISVENAVFQYEGGERRILDHVYIEIEKGNSVAFVGPSGGGKTTLADVVLGLLHLQEGHVLVDGKDIQENIQSWRKNIGYIPQQIYLTDDSIRKNIAFGIEESKIDDEEVWRALEEAQLREFVESLPDGLDTEVGERGVRISGGQKQRIGIARALYRNPSFLVFDEATSALDTETEKEVMKAIDGLHGSKTMLMIAHRLSTIENCDHVYKIENGKVSLER